jgi:hypothetical protein
MNDITKEDLRRFVEGRRRAGPALENQRPEELSHLGDEQAGRMTLDVFGLWRPTDDDDFGVELVEQQRGFRLWRERQRGRR